MPKYEIEQYELHTMRYTVEATNQAQAIQKLLAGRADPIDDALELIEVADDQGMLVADNQGLAAALRSLGVEFGGKLIPSIRSIEEVD